MLGGMSRHFSNYLVIDSSFVEIFSKNIFSPDPLPPAVYNLLVRCLRSTAVEFSQGAFLG